MSAPNEVPGFLPADAVASTDSTAAGDTTVSAPVSGKGITKMLPMFCVLRSGSTKPDLVRSQSTEEVREQVRKQIRVAAGAVQLVYIFQLIEAERYVPFSETLTLEQLQQMHLGVSIPLEDAP